MSSLTKSHFTTSYSVRPNSLVPDDLEKLIQRLKVLIREVSETQIRTGANKLGPARKNLLLRLSNYLRSVKNAQMLLHLGAESNVFDDHDQVASSILYKVSQYENVRAKDDSSRSAFIDSVVMDWAELLATGKDVPAQRVELLKLKSAEPLTFTKFRSLKFGIVTVLEHEYQCVIRRLDRVHACSGDYAYGLAIRFRTHPTEDLKDLLNELTEMGIISSLDLGWTVGSIGSKRVLVICTGAVGKENTSVSIHNIQTRLKLTVEKWLDVGVCAGSDVTWPIGTVLVSQNMVIDLRRTASDRFEKVNEVIKPIRISTPLRKNFSLKTSYRRVPDTTRISVADPNNVQILPVKFACPTEVIRLSHDRNAIRSYLTQEKFLKSNEPFGIDMEGAGTTLHPDSETMCIIKGVTDYADKKSKKALAPGTKVLFQLYAAETAAEFAVDLIRNWPIKLKSRTVPR